MKNSFDGKLLLSAREMALALNVSERTLWSRTSPRGTVPCVRVGQRVLYSPVELQRWIERQTQGKEEVDA